MKKEYPWETVATSSAMYATDEIDEEGNTYTLYATRTGNDKNGNPRYEVNCIVSNEGDVLFVLKMNRTITSYNIRESLINLAGTL